MQEYTINGKIIAEPINARSFEEGMVGLLVKDQKYYRITAMHMNGNGDWVVTGDYEGIVDRYYRMMRFSILTDVGTFPIVFKDWENIIKHGLLSMPTVSVIVKPLKFKPGKYNQVCTECNVSFTASRSQPFCPQCCHRLAVATLNVDFPKKITNFDENFVKSTAFESYEMGRKGIILPYFENWLNNKVHDASNNNQKTGRSENDKSGI